MKIDKLRKLVEVATPGPWEADEFGVVGPPNSNKYEKDIQDYNLIVAMRNHFSALLDVAKAAKIIKEIIWVLEHGGDISDISQYTNEIYEVTDALKRLETIK